MDRNKTEENATSAVLVIGGGIAGIQASLDVADAGFKVYLVEKESNLGGLTAQLHKVFPTLEKARDLLQPLMDRALHHPNIKVLTNARVVSVDGDAGNFNVEVKGAETLKVSVGAIILATGCDTFPASLKPEYGYDLYENVVTALEFERLCSAEGPTGGKILIGGKEPKDIVFILCVGSRDHKVGNPYCSRVCCMYTSKQAHLAREKIPEANITVSYIDVRASCKGCEEFYEKVQKEDKVLYTRGKCSEVYSKNDGLRVRLEDTFLGEPSEVGADLVVLAVGLVPRSDSQELAKILDIKRGEDGFFLEEDSKTKTVNSSREGVFLAGCCQGPKDIADTLTHAKAAASSAILYVLTRVRRYKNSTKLA